MKNSVTFIVKATNDVNLIMRCMASLSRQNCPDYKVLALCSKKEARDRIKEKYPRFKVKKIDGAQSFTAEFNKAVSKIDTKYFVLVNFDEIAAPDAAESILAAGGDTVVFNIAKLNDKGKFSPVYPEKDKFTLKSYVNKGTTPWNVAFNTQAVQKNRLTLGDLAYCDETLYVFKNFSFSGEISVCGRVLAYRDRLMKKKAITQQEFDENIKVIGELLKSFRASDRTVLRRCIIKDFVIPQIYTFEDEKSLFRRIKRKRLLRRFIGL